MLLHKAWLESRFRFLTGLIAVIAVCVIFMKLRPVLLPGWVIALNDPNLAGKPPWLAVGISDVNFYAWHFLYENKLQQVWVLFAILLAFGSINRERANGLATFSLSLPVTRRRWLVTGTLVTVAQAGALGFAAAVATWLAALSNNEPYSLAQALAHCALMVSAGLVFVGATLVISAVVRGDLITIVVALLLLGVPYLFIQEYEREASPRAWVARLDISHVMSGPSRLDWANTPWIGLGVCIAVFVGLWMLAAQLTERAEY